MKLAQQRTKADPTWRTPPEVFNQLDQEFDFTLDPCASEAIVPGIRFFSPEEDGLAQRWTGRVFVNPPYGDGLLPWMQKIVLESGHCEVIVALVPVRSETEWFQDYVLPYASEVRLIRGRIKFVGAPFNAPFPSCAVIYRPKPTDLIVRSMAQATLQGGNK